MRDVRRQVLADLASPFMHFDAIYCINLDRATDRWEQMSARLAALGIDWRVRRFPAVDTPENHHVDRDKPRCARLEGFGFSLRANVALPAHAREQLEHLCRYLLRPPWRWRG